VDLGHPIHLFRGARNQSEASNGTAADRLPNCIEQAHYLETANNVVIVGTDFADDVSLLDIIDHILNAGVVIRGSLVISLAGVDLVYLGLDVILTSVETAIRYLQLQPPPLGSPRRNSIQRQSE
jgi:gas vesicle structural protein